MIRVGRIKGKIYAIADINKLDCFYKTIEVSTFVLIVLCIYCLLHIGISI